MRIAGSKSKVKSFIKFALIAETREAKKPIFINGLV